jgi:hypothetical protein
MSEWMPIETAPIPIICRKMIKNTKYGYLRYSLHSTTNGHPDMPLAILIWHGGPNGEPTHWQPLPAPPGGE